MDEYSNLTMCDNLYQLLLELFSVYKNDETKREEAESEACRCCVAFLIPTLEKKMTTCSIEYQHKYYELWEKSYALAGRRSLEHFIDYMEMDRQPKVLAKRRGILKPFIFYLNKITFDEKLKYIICSYYPSAGKSFCLNYYSAWLFGININNSILRLSYSDDLVLGFSRSIKDILTNPRFSDVFPQYKHFSNGIFSTKIVDNWKIKGSNNIYSHMAVSRDGQITGKRANKAIIFDDMTKGEEEATNSTLHQSLYNKWKTEWYNRKDGESTKFIFAGTMWSPEDILNRVTQDREALSETIPSKQFKYVWLSEDGTTVYIRVPLLDEDDETTCEAVMPTSEARHLRDTTDDFFWSCVYQQAPIAPTGLNFADELLNHYDTLPLNENGTPAYSNYSLAVLDTTRRGKDNMSMPIFRTDGEYYYFTDCIFKAKAMSDMYDEIISKIEEHNITWLVVENNTDTSLKALLEEKLKNKGIYTCVITEKYNTVKKETRIMYQQGLIKKLLVFKNKKAYAKNSDYGKFMSNFTTYSFDYPNKHDDAPDSLAMFVTEIILEKGKPSKPQALNRYELGI